MKKAKLLRQVLAFTLAVGLVGCVAQVNTLSPIPKSQVVYKQYGTVKMTIRWPNSFNTALIPDSTNKLVIKIKKGGEVKATQDVVRNPGQNSVPVVFNDLVAGNAYSAWVEAYRDSEKLAEGNSTEFTIAAGRTTSVGAITLAPLNSPTLSSIDNVGPGNNVGKVGDEIVITGTKFGTGAETIAVSFNGTAATDVTRTSASEIHAKVPAGATCGQVKVTIDGVEVTSNSAFFVINSLSIPATASVVNGSQVDITPVYDWAGVVPEGAPYPEWELTPATKGAITDAGRFTASASGTVSIRAKMGSITTDPCILEIIPYVEGMSLNKTTTTLNARPVDDVVDMASGKGVWNESITATLTGDATNSGVEWTTSDASRVELTAVGTNSVTIQTTETATPGTVTITARSKDNPAVQSSLTVTVTRKGDMGVTVQ